ncbi:MAG: ThuA domain-containing protein [Pyrinomonadaceae bacterium]|nr:ThuA domain-containing protein [Sphingobacteriaceae bacterium]
MPAFNQIRTLTLIILILFSFNLKAAGNFKKPLRVLLITSGCCHNYPLQSQHLKDGLAKLAPAEWTVVNEGGKGTEAMISLYDNPKWAKKYDVVIHNECFADTKTPEYIRKITKAHYKGVPAVVIHCAMHTYRATEVNDWRDFLGVTSRRHDHQSNYPVKKVDSNHPVIKDMPDNWITPKDELYIIEKTWPNTKVLATSVSEKDGKTYPVIWTSKYGKAQIFGTTYGHSDATFADPVFINMVARGILWAAGRLE